MVKITIFYQDLTREVQDKLWARVRNELICRCDVDKEDYETDEEFERRLEEEVDYYINTNNVANSYYL